MRISIVLVVLVMLVFGEACSAPSASYSVATSPAPAVHGDRLQIAYEENGQFELTRSNGSRIFMDVWNSQAMKAPATSSDLLLLTHSEREDRAFQDAFPGPKLITTAGTVKLGDISVVSVEGSHTDEPAVAGMPSSNYIVVFEVDGFRIANLGENGEERLSAAQLAALGTVDVAICPLTNTGGNDETGRKALNVITQLAPRMVIASFTDLDTAKMAAAQWPAAYTSKTTVSIPRSAMKDGTVVFLGQMADNYGEITKAQRVDW